MNNIQLNYSKVDISIKEIICVFHKVASINHSFNHNNRAYYSFALILNGTAEYDYGYKIEKVEKGDLLFLRKGETYSVRTSDNEKWEHIIISFDCEDSQIEQFPFQTVNKLHHLKRFDEIFRNAYKTYNRAGAAYYIQIKALIYEIFATLFQEKEDQFFYNSKYKGIKEAEEYIENNYKEKISVERLAKISGYSVSHFSRLFNELFSCSPVEYINKVRIEKAKNMLRTEMFSLSEIAEECGFSNVYYFSRIFKQTVGVTPKKY